jgi:K+ transport systems, NAD-binding component
MKNDKDWYQRLWNFVEDHIVPLYRRHKMYNETNANALIRRRFFVPIAAIILILIIGFLGYIIIEGYSPLDSLYMMVITFATIGYGEVHPLSDQGRIFTILLIVSGFTVGLYALGRLSAFFMEGELLNVLKLKRMDKALANLKDHYIICGYGKTGKKVLDDLLHKGHKVVMIESNAERNEKLKEIFHENLIHIDGDATSDEVLLHAGLERAKILISVLNTDAENLFVTLSAKDLNPIVKVITRVEDASSTPKFKKAGADFIISQIELASERIVSIATTTTDFFSFVEFADNKEEMRGYKFKLVEIHEGSDLIGKTYREANIPSRTNLVVIGSYTSSENLQVNPKANDVIHLGDRLLVFGKDEQIHKLASIAKV